LMEDSRRTLNGNTRKFQKEFGEASLRGGLPAVVTNVRTFPEGIMDKARQVRMNHNCTKYSTLF
jgi:hypothetical protein